MQQIQQLSSEFDLVAPVKYSVRQRLLSGSLSLAMTSSAAVTAAMAHAPAPTFGPAFSASPVHVVHPVTTATHSTGTWHTSTTPLTHSLVSPTPGASDINLASAVAMFSPATIAGFTQIVLDIGGKQTVINGSTKLTGAELVAAEQVLGGGKQTLVINSNGVATGGTVQLNSTTVSALDGAVHGTIGSLDISHGVKVIDSVANLQLTGSLDNAGSIVMSAAKGSGDTISAANIVNERGALISSNADMSLSAGGTVDNSGRIVAGGNLNISAPTINNSGLLSATTGNVNLTGGGGNLAVNSAGGTVQALNGNINLDTSAANANIAASGGNWLSQQVNFNAGTGNVDANVGELTGVVNATASNAHVTAATGDLQLGNMNVSGDPTYFNTAGNISITGTVNGDPDLAIVASGNIIGGGGALDTSAGNGNITLIAGANFVTSGGTSVPNTSGGGDTTNTITVTDSTAAGKGSKTGGFIDLSGSTLGGKGTPLTSVTSGNGNILMVAYKGSGTNSGSIVATGTTKSGGTANLDAGSGTVTMIGGGAQITAQNVNAGNVTILGSTPTLSATPLTIFDGSITGGAYQTAPTTFTNTAINLTSIATGGSIDIGTAGKTNTSAKAPLPIGGATGLAFTGASASSSLYVTGGGNPSLNINNSSLATGGTLSVTYPGTNLVINGNITGNGTILLNATTGDVVSTGGVIGGASATLTGPAGIVVDTAVNSLTANSTSNLVNIAEAASSAKSLTLNASSSFGAFTLTSSQTVNIKGGITTTGGGGDIDLTETGSSNTAGINISSVLTSASGNINLITTGTDSIVTSKPVVAANITIDAGGVVGSSGAGFQTNASNSLLVIGTSATNSLINIKDIGTGTLNVSGDESTSQPITISSVAGTVNVGQLLYSNVTLSDTATVAKVPATIVINPGAGLTVGDGSGIVKITAAGSISQVVAAAVFGAAVTLTSTTGDIGNGTAISVGGNGVPQTTVTAVATKGLVNLQATNNISLNTASALTSYTVNGAVRSVNIGGTITVTTKGTGAISITSAVITQGPSTAFLSAPNVSLTTLPGGTIGVGPGFQSIQTKATSSLSINGAAGSTAFVTQNGTITLGVGSTMGAGANSTLNLFTASGNKLTVAIPITWDNNNITAPTSLTVSTGGSISGTNVTVTSPSVILNAPGSIAVTNLASFNSTAGLAINGTGTVTLPAGSSLSLSGQSSITLGVSGANDPLNAGITSNNLANLTIFSAGALNANYNSFTTTNSITLQSSSLNNTGGFAAGAFGLTSGNISLTQTNGSGTTIGTTAVTSGQPQFDITSTVNGSTVSVTAGGVLTVNSAGLTFAGVAGNSIALSGRSLNTNGGITDPLYFTTTNTFANVTLGATSGTFTVGGTGTQLNNGIIGSVTATNGVTINAPSGITVNDTFGITGNQLLFNTAAFKLLGNSAVTGTGPASLTIASPTSLTISGTGGTNNIGGTYTNIDSVTLQAATGNVNVGNLFTTTNGTGNMLDSGNVSNITISAAGTVQLPAALPSSILQVSPGGNIFLSAGTVAFSPPSSNPQKFLTLQATGGNVSLFLAPASATANLTLGKVAGSIDISVGAAGSFTASSTNGLIVNETQTVTNATLLGSSITVNNTVNASNNLNAQALGTPTSAITEGTGVLLIAGNTLSLGQSAPTLPVVALNVQAPNIVVGAGALNISNTFNGDVFIAAANNPLAPTTALNFVNATGNTGTNLTIGNITAAAGGIAITNVNGSLVVASNSTIQTSNQMILVPAGTDGTKGPAGTFVLGPTMGGNISLQNNDKGGSINIDSGAFISAFGTAGSGLGQVSITLGTAPTTGLLAGAQPTPNPPLVTTKNGGLVFYTTTANPNGTITSNGQNFLNAFGANIIFNGGGNSSYIALNGNVTIQADPPAVSAASPASTIVTAGGTGAALAANSTLANVAAQTSAVSTSAQTGLFAQNTASSSISQLPINNWSLPTTMGINSNVLSGDSDAAAAISDSDVLSVGGGKLSLNGASSGTKVLTGGVSTINGCVKTLDKGVTLLAPKTQTVLNTNVGSVSIAPGAVVMVMAFDGGMAVYNLHDTKGGAVRVMVAGGAVKLAPGQNIVMTNKQVRSFEEVNPVQAVAYRSMQAKQWAGGVRGFQSEFDIRTMLFNVKGLKDMITAQDNDTRKAIGAVLKTSAILSQLGGEQYQYMNAPVHTAMVSR